MKTTIRQSLLLLFVAALISPTLLSCSVRSQISHATHLPHKSFLFVIKRVTFSICNPKDSNECLPVGSAAISGSGFLVATNGSDTWGMTAGHVCVNEEILLQGPDGQPFKPKMDSTMRVMVLGGAAYEAEIEEVYKTLDLCVVKIVGMKPDQIISVASNPPKRGERHFVMAAPLGTFGPDMLPILEGFYNGSTMNYPPPMGGEQIPYDVFTIPTKGGSSGSPIVNASGELVGVTSGTLVGFENIAFSPPYDGVRTVVESVQRRARKGL